MVGQVQQRQDVEEALQGLICACSAAPADIHLNPCLRLCTDCAKLDICDTLVRQLQTQHLP